MYPHIETPQALTVIIDGKPHAVTKDHASYDSILHMVQHHVPTVDSDEDLLELIKPIQKFNRIIGNDNTGFTLEGSTLRCTVDGVDFPLPRSLYTEILRIYNNKSNLEPLYNFVLKLSRNPRKEVIDELWGFISSCGLAITEQGNFLAYKNVNNDFMDIFSGTMSNAPGRLLEMPRWAVEHDPNRTCAAGLHFAAWGYLAHYAPGRKTVLLSISPEDVVSIPTDYNNMKGRACRYKVLREVDQPEELNDMSVYNEQNELVDTSESDSTWIKWSKEDRKSVEYDNYTPTNLNTDNYLEVKCKDGTTIKGYPFEFHWGQLNDKDVRIVAYRIIKE